MQFSRITSRINRNFFNTLLVAFFTLATLFSPVAFFVERTHAQNLPTFIFLRDLRLGDSGDDVLELQKILNTDVVTKISDTGAGSPGNETVYFGPATKAAVIRFQNKYADEVLRPAGLVVGDGSVGLWTRLKLNQIILKSSVAVLPSIQTQTSNTSSSDPLVTSFSLDTPLSFGSPASVAAQKELSLSFASRNYGPAGSTVTLTGTGFSTQSNTVNLGALKIKNIAAQNSANIRLTIPNTTPAGRYDISVTVGSKTTPTTIPFMVTTPGASIPVIEKVEPVQAKFGEPITVTGRNFTATGNIVSSGLGIIQDVKSTDGKTLTFTIPLPESMKIDIPQVRETWFNKKDNLYWPVRIHVTNVNGVSDSPAAAGFIINI